MKIRVSYSELVSGPGYNNRRAEAELEVEINGNLDTAYQKAWAVVKEQVKRQLNQDKSETNFELPF